jgi:organic radical activating enzyme
MDLKLPSVGKHEEFLEEHRKFLRIAASRDCYLKIIVSRGLDREEFSQHIKMIGETAPGVPVFIQPAWQEREDLKGLLAELIQSAVKEARDVRLGIQIHKMLHVR